jgi:hypothetical protein
VSLPSPAYAVALEGDAEIYPLAVSVGLEPLRVQALSSYPPFIAFAVVWTNSAGATEAQKRRRAPTTPVAAS